MKIEIEHLFLQTLNAKSIQNLDFNEESMLRTLILFSIDIENIAFI